MPPVRPQPLAAARDAHGLAVTLDHDADHGDGLPAVLLTLGRTSAAFDLDDPIQRSGLADLRDALESILDDRTTAAPESSVPGRGRAVEAAPVYERLSTPESTRRVLSGFGDRGTEVEASAHGVWIMRRDVRVWIAEPDVGAFAATVEAAEQDHYRLAGRIT